MALPHSSISPLINESTASWVTELRFDCFSKVSVPLLTQSLRTRTYRSPVLRLKFLTATYMHIPVCQHSMDYE